MDPEALWVTVQSHKKSDKTERLNTVHVALDSEKLRLEICL